METQLCTIHKKLFEKFEPYKMELEQCLDQLLQNKMMDFEVVMDDLPFSDGKSCGSGSGTDCGEHSDGEYSESDSDQGDCTDDNSESDLSDGGGSDYESDILEGEEDCNSNSDWGVKVWG